jgi:hypothetical protein
VRLGPAALIPLLAACSHLESTPPSPSRLCNARGVQSLVGQPYTARRAEWARGHSNARTVQAVGPDDVVALIYDRTRLTILFGADGKISRINCG